MKGWTAVLVTAAVLGGCAQDEAEETGLTFDSAAVSQPEAGALTDGQIARIVMTANTADSAGGTMAQERASDQAVRAFGERMVQDHGSANQQAAQLTQGGTLAPEESDMSRQLESDHQQASQRLQGLSGAEFDRAYIEHEVQMHQTLLDALDQQLIPNAQNPQLTQLLQSVRTTVQSHLEQARQIQGTLGQGGTADTASTRGQ